MWAKGYGTPESLGSSWAHPSSAPATAAPGELDLPAADVPNNAVGSAVGNQRSGHQERVPGDMDTSSLLASGPRTDLSSETWGSSRTDPSQQPATAAPREPDLLAAGVPNSAVGSAGENQGSRHQEAVADDRNSA